MRWRPCFPSASTAYVIDELIDWSAAPGDPIYRLVFPQPDMLPAQDVARLADLIRREAPQGEVQAAAGEPQEALRRFQYACCPLAVLVASIHGQVEPVSLVFLVGAYLAARSNRGLAAGTVPLLFFITLPLGAGTPVSRLPAVVAMLRWVRPIVGEWGWTAWLTGGNWALEPAYATAPFLIARPTRWAQAALAACAVWAGLGYVYLTQFDYAGWARHHSWWAMSSVLVIPLLALTMPWSRRRPPSHGVPRPEAAREAVAINT